MQQAEVPHHGAPASTDMTSLSSGSTAPSSQLHPIDPLQQQKPPSPPSAKEEPPISSRPLATVTSSSDELAPAVQAENSPSDDAALAAVAGEAAERGVATGNRWPRQETLALLKIRSEMDAAFRDATLKGPLWNEVSRKLAELGYKRSTKKCREKFENVHKYHKRTKGSRAGRPDGKSYRFFNQLEALNAASTGGNAATMATVATPASAHLTATTPVTISFSSGVAATGQPIPRVHPLTISAAAPSVIVAPSGGPKGIFGSMGAAATFAGVSFSSNSSLSVSSSDSDDEVEAGGSLKVRKRKRSCSGSFYGGSRSSSRKMMAFFEGLMKQLMERQEAMQLQFLETMERREQDRMIREEAWRRQEMGRLSREQDLLAQERAMAASRDAIFLSYLETITSQSTTSPAVPFVSTIFAATTVIPLPQPLPAPPIPVPVPVKVTPSPAPAPPMQVQPLQQHPPPSRSKEQEIAHNLILPALELGKSSERRDTSVDTDSLELASSSRWPEAEVHALIKIRSGLESRYEETAPKGPLWEEISAGMRQLGYNRRAKKCKEKWENINKYFKKVKESNKRRREDAKTCPYFHQLDALYRKKLLSRASAAGSTFTVPPNTAAPPQALPQEQQHPPDAATGQNGSNSNSISNVNSEGVGGSGGDGQVIQSSDGGIPREDFAKEMMRQQHQRDQMDDYDKMEEATDSDNLDQDFYDEDDEEEYDEDDEEKKKMQYKIQFQRLPTDVQDGGGGNGKDSTTVTDSAAAIAN